jgi:very-short-patch-repair endonuclease
VLNAWGFRVLHFSYRQVMDDWPTVLSTIQMVRRQVSQGRRNPGARRRSRSRIRGSD